ncbi:MAG: enoyl-CoA hydratase/isomerase family protein [Thaumarchaeota archaeon]|nr:enoyl-CoA hydratase/isomerase family protein [Nitrososphaerota archaeon]
MSKRGSVAYLTLNRPEALNAVNGELAKDLGEKIKLCSGDGEVSCVVVRGSGRSFSAGGDVREMLKSVDSGDYEHLIDLMGVLHGTIRSMRMLSKPILAAINGVVAGGGWGIALACDLRLATKSARFVSAFTNIGLAPDSGSTYFLPRIIGESKALELFLTNRSLSADEAYSMGLVNRVVPDGGLDAATDELASFLAQSAPQAVSGTKALVYGSFENDLEEQLEHEVEVNESLGRSEDFKEGLKAFLEKRKPHFTGN